LKKFLLLFISLFLFALADIFLNGCKKDPIVADNPYDSVNYNKDSVSQPDPDPNSITGLHKNIFITRCALPGCHDGTFEPDYRTVQSSYSTLVYQPVNKFTVDSVSYFKYRVLPYDTINSFLHERLTTHTSDYMPSNGTRLKEEDIQHINAWIMNGARDQFGSIPSKPDNPPMITAFFAADSAIHQIDTNRLGGVLYNPFIVKPNMTVLVVPVVSDDQDTLPSLQQNQLKLSLDKDDFSSAVVINATYVPLYKVWMASFKTTAYPSGTTVYMRYYVKDHAHSTPTEFPRNDSPFYYKTYAAFYVQ
jgi:hypothetical protein